MIIIVIQRTYQSNLHFQYIFFISSLIKFRCTTDLRISLTVVHTDFISDSLLLFT